MDERILRGEYKGKKVIIKEYKGSSDKYFAILLDDLIWDISCFRPDPRDIEELKKLLEFGVEALVLFENFEYTNKISKFPRYIIWKNELFVNIR